MARQKSFGPGKPSKASGDFGEDKSPQFNPPMPKGSSGTLKKKGGNFPQTLDSDTNPQYTPKRSKR